MATITADKVEAPQRPTRVISTRRQLPSARALIGALLVTIAALGSFAVATSGSDGPNTEYLVLRSPIRAGEPVGLADVMLEPMELSPSLTSKALSSTDGLEGAAALRDLGAGELLLIHDLIPAPIVDGEPLSNVHELTFAVPLDRTPAGLRSGDRVTILGTTDRATLVAIEDAIVLAIDTQPDQIGSSGSGILTLAIDDPGDVMNIAHATQTTDITVVRSTRALADHYPPIVTTPATESAGFTTDTTPTLGSDGTP